MVSYNKEYLVGKPVCEKEEILTGDDYCIHKRELLRVELNKKGEKIASIIMMNPSKADSDQSDTTVNKIIEMFHQLPQGQMGEDIIYLNILNILPIYNSKSSDLLSDFERIIELKSENFMTEILDNNMSMIESKIRESEYIILAWGMPKQFTLPLYYTQVAKVLQMLDKSDEIYVLKAKHPTGDIEVLTKDYLNPPHPSRCEISGLVKVMLQSHFRIK
ncbi:DUF1643 domain-containing protein [Lysinibacillus fusiformis]|uniref:DUF1643 domain-containing protein n=1 Tax=Lysinibacillus fusiformis TaxID=28031 RepID=UPI001966E309|nr:DUF1643 domain-containing protein [Lysinibacillus fusiformis]QSB09087.1 DUF1643 domain-containing protein [Lysinibacillus fusiformis]